MERKGNNMIVRVIKKQMSDDVEKVEDLALAADMAIKVLKSDPMVVGEPIAEVSSGCPMGFAKPKIILYYNEISPSLYDKIIMFLTRTSLQDAIKNTRMSWNLT
jgi:hypothetical protein